MPPRKRTCFYLPPSPTDFTPPSQPFELGESARAAIAQHCSLPLPSFPDFTPLPRVFEIGESSRAAMNQQSTISTLMAHMERHEKQTNTDLESVKHTTENLLTSQDTMQQKLGTLDIGLQETRDKANNLEESHGQLRQDIPVLYENELMLLQETIKRDNDLLIAQSKIATLEKVVEDNQVQYQESIQTLLNKIVELESRLGGASSSGSN
jgi:chromosome segregation ATPase